MCFGGGIGAQLDAAALDAQRLDHALFNETAGCFVIEVSRENYECAAFQEIDHTVIGLTTSVQSLIVQSSEKIVLNVELNHLLKAWQRPMKELFNQWINHVYVF